MIDRLLIILALLLSTGCATLSVRGGPSADLGTVAVSGVESGYGGHVEAVGYFGGGRHGIGPSLQIAGYSAAGDADPIAFTTLELRYRPRPKTPRPEFYWEVGSGIGAAWTPSLDHVAIPLQVEAGLQRDYGGVALTLGLRERLVGLIGRSPDVFNSVQLLLGVSFISR